MKKQYLFSALAFSAFLASCSNEIETVAESVKQEAEMEEIVGADLVANGMTINVGGTESRAMNGSWLTTDLLALAWYNVTKNIYDPQDKDAWEGMDSEDPKIYGNHKFTPNENGEFVTESNVYQGGHFVYFPYKREAKVQKKTVEVNKLAYTTKPENDPNPNVYEYDFYNKAFHLSAQDYIDVDDVVDGKLVKQFVMSPMVNAINVHADSKVEGDALKALEITEVKIASDRTVFDQAFDIVPTEIPAVVRDKNDNIDEALTIKALDAYARDLGADYKTNISREVKPGFKLTQETNNLVLYALPTNPGYKGNKNGLRMIVSVKSEHGLVGKFTIQADEDETAQNNASIERFQELLKKVNVESESKKESLQEIRRNGSNWYPLNTKIELTNDNVAIEWNIANKDQWDDAVALASDLGKDVTFTLTDEVEFTESINLPEELKLTVVSGTDGKMIIAGDVEWPNTDDLDVTAANIVVEEDATLSINGEEGNRNALVGKLVNKGTIALNEYGTVGAAANGEIPAVNVVNEAGRIEVKYGSYVFADGGIIAFEAKTTTPAYEIDNLINANINMENYVGQALVNTLVVNAENELNLNKVDNTVSYKDPYTGKVVMGGVAMPNLSEIDIEMNGGKMIANANSGKSVKNVEVLGGEGNEIWNIDIVEDLIVTNGKVTVDASVIGTYKQSLNIQNIDNKSELVANTNIFVKNISNPVGVKTNVTAPYTIWYTDVYTQGGTANGRILKTSAGAAIGGTSYTTLQEAIKNAGSNAVIKLEAGVYEEDVTLDDSNNITLESATGNPADVIFAGQFYRKQLKDSKVTMKNVTITAASAPTTITGTENMANRTAVYSHYDKVDYLFDGCIVSLPDNYRLFASLRGEGTVTIKNCTITNCSISPINISGTAKVIIENNVFEGTAEAAVTATREGGEIVFKNNTISMTYGILLHKNWSTKDWTIDTDCTSNAYHTGVAWNTITVNDKSTWTEVTPEL